MPASRLDNQGREVIDLSESPPPSPPEQGLKLRDYQRRGLDTVLEALRDGQTRVGVSSPPGSGKTAMIAALIPEIPAGGKGRYWRSQARPKVMVIVPTRELVEQVVDTIKGYSINCGHVGVEQGSTKSSRYDTIIVATWQSLMQPGRLGKFDQSHFKAIVSDEAHGDAADRLLGILHWANDEVEPPKGTRLFAKVKHGHKVPIIGFSATFARTDKRKLSWVFEKVVYHLSLEDLQGDHYLCSGELINLWDKEVRKLEYVRRLRGELPPSPKDEPVTSTELQMLTGEAPTSGDDSDFNKMPTTKSMLHIAKLAKFFTYVVDTYVKYASDRKATLIFCANIKTVVAIVDQFAKRGIEARGISSKTSDSDRQRVFEDFKANKFPVLVNCFIMAEGIDIPMVDAIIIAKPVKSKTLWTQMIGRGLRPSPETGKVNCKVITLFDSYQTISLGLEPKL